MGHDSPDYIHVVTEAMKLAFADRDAFYADPNFVDVPIQQLLSDNYTQLRRELIVMQQASHIQRPGDPFHMRAELGTEPRDHREFSGFSNDTSNCLVADQWGNVVAATPSGWGGVQAGDSGVQLGSRMIGLTTWEGHPSVLVPGKRPRITLTPTLVMKDNSPVLAISVAGGDQQDQASIQIALNRLVFGFDAPASVQTARFSTRHHIDWFGHLPFQPVTLAIPKDLSPEIETDLKQRGHEISRSGTAGAAVVLTIDPDSGLKSVAADHGKQAVAY
jgi:gamma-glutamyltranspeptidase/glutathione hydrolase